MPQEILVERFDQDDIFEIAVYRNEDLDGHRGTAPEYTLVNHLSPALTDIGINHRIRWDFDPIPINNNHNGCPSSSDATTAKELWGDYWHNGNAPYEAKDSNIMLTDAAGGGCADVGGPVAVGPGERIDQVYERFGAPDEGKDWTIRAAMHEIGHNMGFLHNPNPGDKWIDENERMHTTPCNGNMTNTENMCGDTVAARPDNGKPRVPEVYYHDCVAEHIRYADPDPGSAKVVDVRVFPNPVAPGETVTIEGTMENTRQERVQREELVVVGDQDAGHFNFDVPAGGTQTDTIQYTPQSVGEFFVQSGFGADTLIVEENPTGNGDVEVVGIEVIPNPAKVGHAATIVVTGRAVNDAAASRTFDVLVSGLKAGEVTFDLPARQPNRDLPEDSVGLSWTPGFDDEAVPIVCGGVTREVAVLEGDGGGVPGGLTAGGVALGVIAAGFIASKVLKGSVID